MLSLARNWWAFLLRGLLALVFGILTFLQPGVTMLSLALLFGVYAAVDGVFALVAAVRAARHGERWGLFALEGVVGLLAGAASILMPGLTVLVFIALVAVWALMTGGFMLAAAFRLDAAHGRWWLALGAAASLLYGALLVISPMVGALVLTWWIGGYAMVFGIAMLIFAARLRARLKAG